MKNRQLLSVKYFIVIINILCNICYSDQNKETKFISRIDSSLKHLVQLQKDIKTIHPFLKDFHPIAIVESDHFYIFDFDSFSHKYRYIKKDSINFPMPKGVRASFPLSGYNSNSACIVTEDIFNSKDGYVTIFHEFIHCTQFKTFEHKLKNKLKIAQDANERNDYSWEINHPFPYQDSLFIEYYGQLIQNINNKNDEAITKCREKLKHYLNQTDFEYLIWIEWKEGFARLIENRIQIHLGLKKNHYGKEKPYNRVCFYHGGSKFIDYLVQKEPDLYVDIELLFNKMFYY